MGIISGFVRKEQDRYVYLDLEGFSHTVSVDNVSFFSAYERDVEFASRLIVNLKRFGFDPAIRQADRAKSMSEFQDVAPQLSSALERYAMIYENGIS